MSLMPLKLALPLMMVFGHGIVIAEASAIVFGVLDASIGHFKQTSRNVSDDDPVSVSRTSMGSSGLSASRLGFRGSEDLGGGLGVGFWLESSLNNDDGRGLAGFMRRSTVSLTGALGEVRGGRDYAPVYIVDNLFSPFGAQSIGTSQTVNANIYDRYGGTNGFGGNANYMRVSNSISYLTSFGDAGWYAQVQYGFGEQLRTPFGHPSVGQAGANAGGILGFKSRALEVAGAWGRSVTAVRNNGQDERRVATFNVGASYDFGFIKLMANRARSSARDASVLVDDPTNQFSGVQFGFTLPVGNAVQVLGSVSRVNYPSIAKTQEFGVSKKYSVGFVKSFSRRTAIYGTIAIAENEGGVALTVGGPSFIQRQNLIPARSLGYDVGLRHSF